MDYKGAHLRLIDLSKRFPFHRKFRSDMKSNMMLLNERFLNEAYLKDALDDDKKSKSMIYLHFLTAVFMDDPAHLETALKLAEEALERSPTSFNALWNQAFIHLSRGKIESEKYQKLEAALTTAADDKREMLIAKIEIADMYSEFLEEDNPVHTMSMYKQVLLAASNLSDSEDESVRFSVRVLSWKVDLATKYLSIMRMNPDVSFQRKMLLDIEKLLKEVIESELPDAGDCSMEGWITEHKEERASAMTELANAKFEYFKNGLKSSKILYGDTEYYFLEGDIEYFYLEAIHTYAPRRESYVYECYGEFWEYCAKYCHKTVESWLKAVDLYQKAVEIDAMEDVVDADLLHKIGLAYREVWSIEGNHESQLKKVRADDRKWTVA